MSCLALYAAVGIYDINPVPPPTVNYQGDGKKRRKRKNSTYELFDRLESTLRQVLHGDEPVVATAKAVVIDVEHGIEVALKQLTEAATGNADLSIRLAQIRTEVALFEAKIARDEEDEEDDAWIMMN